MKVITEINERAEINVISELENTIKVENDSENNQLNVVIILLAMNESHYMF